MSEYLKDAWDDWLIAVGALHDGRSTKREAINALFDAVGAILHHLDAAGSPETSDVAHSLSPIAESAPSGPMLAVCGVMAYRFGYQGHVTCPSCLAAERGRADVYDGEQVRRILCTTLEIDGVNLQPRRGAQLIGVDADLVRTILGGGK